jgi:hypothetical protein
VYWAKDRLSDAPQWADLIAEGETTEGDKSIIVAMSANEGAISSVQSYDSELLTAGAMQKTIKISGLGQLSTQIEKFKSLYPADYAELFEAQGWYVESSGPGAKMYYKDQEWSGGVRLEGRSLINKLREGCSESNYGGVINCKPVAVMVCAIGTPNFIRLQIGDFIIALEQVRDISPMGYDFTVRDLFKSLLGQATVLDEYVNRPNSVSASLKVALDDFYISYPAVSKNPASWGVNYAQYESIICDKYGNGRSGMTEPVKRYAKLKVAINA